MAYNFKPYDVNQLCLLPPNMRDWLPQGHLVWFVIDLVSQMDLSDFYKEYNERGEGRAAYDPKMMVALYLYAYCNKVRSSREIERLCMESVPFRVISGDRQPDHVTISRFRKNFEAQLASLMTQVLSFCYRCGLLNLNTTSIDGTKVKANASPLKNRSERWIEEEITKYLKESEEIDLEEDELYGPEGHKYELIAQEERLRKLQEFKEILASERKKKLESHKEKLEERERQESRGSKRRGRKPLKVEEVEERTLEKAKVNLTDPESRIMKTAKGYLQGYNAQAVVSEDQVIIAAELTQECNDRRQLRPMIEATKENLHEVDDSLKLKTLLGDAGYFSSENVEGLKRNDPDVLLAVSKECRTYRKGEDNVIPMPLTPASLMKYRLHRKEGKKLYRKRSITVEPVFGHIKEVLGFDRFMRRGLNACICEWKLICTVHNILKLWRYGFDKVRDKAGEAKAIFIETEQNIQAIAL